MSVKAKHKSIMAVNHTNNTFIYIYISEYEVEWCAANAASERDGERVRVRVREREGTRNEPEAVRDGERSDGCRDNEEF